MFIQENVSLKPYSTMRLGGNASYLTQIQSREEVAEAANWAAAENLPLIMIGIGSNIIWSDDGFKGLVIVNRIPGYQVFDEDEENTYVKIGAGVNWDGVVARTVGEGLSGIESLSLIPGTAGATPVQNVGAYGQEISDTLVSLEAFDTQQKTFVTIPASDCKFDYRTSRFNSEDKGRFLITSITLHLSRKKPQPPFYTSVQAYLDEKGIKDYTPQVIREAVITIRTAKLPDPSQIANTGSFFGNPIVPEKQLAELRAKYPEIQYWNYGPGYKKISAAWMLEQAGLKDFHDPETGMATWPNQPLVFINESAQNTASLFKFKQKVMDKVREQFGIALNQEPEYVD